MGTERLWHRLLQWAGDAWRSLMSILDRMDGPDGDPDIDPDTAVTFRAITDAVLPETPELEEKLGADHGPGGLATDLDAFHASYVDDGFQFGLPHLGFLGNVPVADPVAEVLDLAAATLVERGDNESEPSVDRAVSLIDG
ncbi:MAG: hypothetical protein ACI8XM_002600, partial [Haloarculaceae archaeon]